MNRLLLIINFGCVLSVCLLCYSCDDDIEKRSKFQKPTLIEQLGELLFFDPILSADSTISCASCHKPEFAFADTSAFSKGVNAKLGSRNTPSAMNLDNHSFFFWDGRATSLEEQALGPIENPIEMNLPVSEAIKRLKRHAFYREFFIQLAGGLPSRENLSKVLAQYQRSLSTSDTPFDDYMKRGDSSSFKASEKRGQQIFNEKAKCFDCHFGPDFSNDDFRNIGLFDGTLRNDSGRFSVTKKISDIGKFKTPGLRNVSVTAPYMHDGSFKTLREVIEFYNDPEKVVKKSVNRDSLLEKPLNLTEQEKKDLENFLLSLTDKKFSKNLKSNN